MARLSRAQARRIAVRAQLLDAARPAALLPMVEHLTFLQLDPTAAIAPSADLVAWSRLGGGYRPEHLQGALEDERALFEHRTLESPKAQAIVVTVRPMSQLGLYLADMTTWPTFRAYRDWLDANAGFARRVLDQLAAEGPLLSRDIPDTADVPWRSTGWTNEQNVTRLLEFLSSRGEVAVAGRRGRDRVWDLAERVFPPGVDAVPSPEAHRRRDVLRLRSLGVARPGVVGDAGEPVEVEGTTGEWRVDPEATADGFEGRTALLSPFDRLVHDRVRALELFEFEYTLEMYKPAPKRRWGYFALPILHGDRLVGKLDATADRKAGVLRVNAVHEDVRFTRPIATAVRAEVGSLASWMGLAPSFP